jgi:hypothetical protein
MDGINGKEKIDFKEISIKNTIRSSIGCIKGIHIFNS